MNEMRWNEMRWDERKGDEMKWKDLSDTVTVKNYDKDKDKIIEYKKRSNN